MFGPLVILYLFLGGASAASFLVMSAWSVYFHRRNHRPHFRLARAFKRLKIKCYTISLIALALSLLCLLGDLVRPERVLELFLRPHFSVISFGAFALVVELIIGLILTCVNAFDLSIIRGRTKKILEILCCITSIAVMLYTGIFLSSNASIPFWNTWSLALLIFFSSLSAGISLVLLIDYFIQDQTILLRAARPLQKVHIACLLTEAVLLVLFLEHAFSNPDASKSFALLLEPTMLATGLIGVIGMGITIPSILETYTLSRKECRTIPVSDAICLFGSLCLRYCLVMTGVH